MHSTPLPLEFFYAPPSAIHGGRAVIEGNEYVHLTHVMRKRESERIMLVDGAGTAYEAVIVETAGRRAVCELGKAFPGLHEPARDVRIGVAVLKNGAAFDFLVEKCTELGVRSIVPLFTERTIPRHGRQERWQKLALAAMKQCGRCQLPRVSPPATLDAFLAGAGTQTLNIIPYERSTEDTITQMVGAAGPAVPVALCIGPEGGFSEEEVARAVAAGFRPATLGPTRLRTETAAIVAAALSLSSSSRPPSPSSPPASSGLSGGSTPAPATSS